MIRRIGTLAVTLLALTSSLAAQRRATLWERWRPPAILPTPPADSPRSAPTLGMIAAGVGGGVVGFVAGGLIGYQLGGGNLICGDDSCGLEEAAYGAIAGESILLPLGVHLANHRRGNYGLSFLASAALGGFGILAVNASNDGSPLIAVPIAQLVTSIIIERATSRGE